MNNKALILPAETANISTMAKQLQAGDIAAIPTETVYGLAGDATNPAAVARIYTAKQRPARNPLIIHYASIDAMREDVYITPLAEKLAQAFWPGPLTLVLPQTPTCRISDLATAGLDTLAVRVPAHPVTQALLTACQRPLAAPSANRSGQLSPVSATQVAASLGDRIGFILDGGPCERGIESTILDVSGDIPHILRPGSITEAMLTFVIGPVQYGQAGVVDAPKAPGMLYRHYAPACPLRLSVDKPIPGETLIAFGPGPIPEGFASVLNLSPQGDLNEAAQHLFDYLYQCEQSGATRIAVMPIPSEGVGVAINERLHKAAEAVVA